FLIILPPKPSRTSSSTAQRFAHQLRRDKFPQPQPLHRAAFLWSNPGEVRDAWDWTGDNAPMDSMLKPKLPDDPHDIIVVAPDAIRVAPADAEASDPIRDLMQRAPSEPQSHAGSDFTAEAAVPPVDATFRATAVNEAVVSRRSIGRQVLRAGTALLLTACIGGAA